MRLIIAPPAAAAEWRVLRRTTDTITGPSDNGAVVVAEWGRFEGVIDADGLVNGQPVFYRVYYRDRAGQPVAPGGPDNVTETPAAIARDTSADPMGVLRMRMVAGLAAAVADGRLTPRTGSVPVVTAPFVNPDKTTFPMISMHMDSDSPSERFIAEYIIGESLDGIGYDDTEGWLSQVTINLIAVSLNPDERNELGRVMKFIVAANLEILSAHGLMKPAITMAQTELAPEGQAAPLYLATGTFTCLCVTSATGRAPIINTVLSTAQTYQEAL